MEGGNKLKGQHFRLDWAWISLQQRSYVVDEQAGLLEVVLRRRGYLGETSFVGKVSHRENQAYSDAPHFGRGHYGISFAHVVTPESSEAQNTPEGETVITGR
ncbi:hypothetical protein NFI96_008005 [Prochilodus magdalenae]|nr:hypothetical protein NFI96_008005 [Prochilodus magdalenae]